MSDDGSDIDANVIKSPIKSKGPKKEEKLYITPTEYKKASEYSISTMTITTKIVGLFPLIDLEKIYERINPGEDDNFLEIKHKYSIKSVLPEKKKRKNSMTKKVFHNQLTMVVAISSEKNVNIKIFSNGKIQMTGCRGKDDIKAGMKQLLHKIVDIDDDPPIFCAGDKLKYTAYNIEMINSNYAVGFHINLKELYYILDDIFRKKNKYIIALTYESSIYPGINLKLANLDELTASYENKHGQVRYDKKISVFIFGSGNVIITGANKTEQIDVAYEYVNSIIKDNFKKIVL
jgi:TATA-box binding protein (TBP) (component of TFIID and TFIIIB)